jgi:hypothetical protein
MTIGFLLGAGFSKGMHKDMPLMKDIVSMLSIPDYIPGPIRADLEQTLSYLWTDYPWNKEREYYRNRAEFLRLAEEIHEVITAAEYHVWCELLLGNLDKLYGPPQFQPKGTESLWTQPPVMLWQAAFAGLLADNENYCVVTTNYDTLLERFMIENKQIQLIYSRRDRPRGNSF